MSQSQGGNDPWKEWVGLAADLLGILGWLGLVGQTIFDPGQIETTGLLLGFAVFLWILTYRWTRRKPLPEGIFVQAGQERKVFEPRRRRHWIGLIFLGIIPLVTVPLAIVSLKQSQQEISPPATASTPLPSIEGSEALCSENDQISLQSGTFRRDLGVTLFNVENTNGGILSNYIRAVDIDERGVWFGYFPPSDAELAEGIGLLIDKNWRLCNSQDEPVGQQVNDIAIDGAGNVWVVTDGFGVARFDGEQWEVYNHTQGQLQIRITL
jgi:hypothetical protein